MKSVCTRKNLNMFVMNVLCNKNSMNSSSTDVLMWRKDQRTYCARYTQIKITFVKLLTHNSLHHLEASTIKAGTGDIKLLASKVFTEPETDVFHGNFISQRICSSNQVTFGAYLFSIEAHIYFIRGFHEIFAKKHVEFVMYWKPV